MATVNCFLPQNNLIHQQNIAMDGSALKHFKLPDDKKAFKAKCMHCTSEIKGSLKVTSNFVTHLRVSTVSDIYIF